MARPTHFSHILRCPSSHSSCPQDPCLQLPSCTSQHHTLTSSTNKPSPRKGTRTQNVLYRADVREPCHSQIQPSFPTCTLNRFSPPPSTPPSKILTTFCSELSRELRPRSYADYDDVASLPSSLMASRYYISWLRISSLITNKAASADLLAPSSPASRPVGKLDATKPHRQGTLQWHGHSILTSLRFKLAAIKLVTPGKAHLEKHCSSSSLSQPCLLSLTAS